LTILENNCTQNREQERGRSSRGSVGREECRS